MTRSCPLRANIATIEQAQELFNTNSYDHQENIDTFSSTNSTEDNIPKEYAPIIAAFRQSSNIICNACGSKGQHTSKCYKRGLDFLHCDVQCRVTAHNTKYGSLPQQDSSPDAHKSFHALGTPYHRPPPTPSKPLQPDTTSNDKSNHTATFSSLTHVLPSEDSAEILVLELGIQSEPTIKMMQHTDSTMSTPTDNFTLQDFHCQAIYEIDSNTSIHVLNFRSDFITYHKHQSKIFSTPNLIATLCEDCFSLNNPLCSFWIQTVFEQYDKNTSYMMFTHPLPKATISSNHIILKSVPAPTVNPTYITSLWKLNIQHCVHGKPSKGIYIYIS